MNFEDCTYSFLTNFESVICCATAHYEFCSFRFNEQRKIISLHCSIFAKRKSHKTSYGFSIIKFYLVLLDNWFLPENKLPCKTLLVFS